MPKKFEFTSYEIVEGSGQWIPQATLSNSDTNEEPKAICLPGNATFPSKAAEDRAITSLAQEAISDPSPWL